MNQLKISIVSYLNSKPFLYGLKNSNINKQAEISLDTPSEIAQKLKNSKTDIGLIPIAALKDLNSAQIISNYCIGSFKAVKTVVLASNIPITQIKSIYLDYQSRTSVMLAKVLAEFYWKQEFNWLPAKKDFEKTQITDTTAGVVIGDRVFEIEEKYPYIYDLSLEWYNFTRLPFVFAVWVSNKKIDASLENQFNKALEFGLNNIQNVVEQEKIHYPGVNIKSYLEQNIDFNFNNKKKQALQKFLTLVNQL